MKHASLKKKPGSGPASDMTLSNGKRIYLERYGDHIKAARTWRMFAFLMGGVALVATTGLGVVSSQQRVVPYVVQVDKMHTVLPVGPADQAARPNASVVRASLGSYITNTRSVYVDAAATRKNILSAYSMMEAGSPAYQTVNDFMKANDPFKRAQTEAVSVEIQSVLPVGGDTWRVEWAELRRGRDGLVIGSQQWTAVLTTAIVPPTDEAQILANPLGVFVTALSWSPRI